jgi:hypothetical protein
MYDEVDTKLIEQIRTAVAAWVTDTFETNEIVIGEIAEDNEIYEGEEEAVRYLVDVAVRSIGYWLVVEAWVQSEEVLSISNLGEGLPLNDLEWPWPEEGRGEENDW